MSAILGWIMPIQRNSIREQIRDTLLERIASGRRQPGERVVEAIEKGRTVEATALLASHAKGSVDH